MEDYNSRHTGPVIDDAVDRAKEGGAIDESLSGKAPAGFGLGGSAQDWFSSDFNDYTSNGWWRFGSVASFTNAPPLGFGVLRVDCRESNLCQQTFYALGDGIVMQRYHNGSSWQPWEYVNPPIQPSGIDGNGNPINEYRTTERYCGKPVYIRLYECGDFPPAGTNKTIPLKISGLQHIVRYSATTRTLSLPFHAGNNSMSTERGVDIIGITSSEPVIRLHCSLSDPGTYYKAYVTVYYTKTTD